MFYTEITNPKDTLPLRITTMHNTLIHYNVCFYACDTSLSGKGIEDDRGEKWRGEYFCLRKWTQKEADKELYRGEDYNLHSSPNKVRTIR
jgi:hypothetical protein